MNSNDIIRLLTEIGETSSKNEKLAMVKSASADPEFVRVLKAALNPLITYGVAKRPEVAISRSNEGAFTEATWTILDDLAKRKLTGNAARDTIASHMSTLSPASAELMWRIINKDLRAGFGESTCNKAVKGMIPEFPYMRCSLPKDVKLESFSWAQGVYSQMKADGMFGNVDHYAGEVTITSRQGQPYPLDEFQQLVADIKAHIPDDTQTHGELLVYQDGVCLPREISNGIMNSVASGGKLEPGQTIHFMAWDNIPIQAVVPKGVHKEPYKDRFSRLKESIGDSARYLHLIETRVVYSMAEARQHFKEMLERGLEGTVFKDGNAEWKDGTSKQQVKLKVKVDVDLKVVGIVPGRDGTKNEGRAGSLSCATSDGLLWVDVAVKNEAMRDKVDAANDDWIGRIIPVSFNAILAPSPSNGFHSLFLPRMVEADYRRDKNEADSLQRVKDQYEAALEAA